MIIKQNQIKTKIFSKIVIWLVNVNQPNTCHKVPVAVKPNTLELLKALKPRCLV